MPSKRKPTHADAELALKLYDLRREAEMRKARKFVTFDFWPSSAGEVTDLYLDVSRPENAWLRQAVSYWDMAASLVTRGILHPTVFYDWCTEAWFVFAKYKPMVKEIRSTLGQPRWLATVEEVVEGTPEGRERLKAMAQRIAQRRAMAEERRKSVASASAAAARG